MILLETISDVLHLIIGLIVGFGYASGWIDKLLRREVTVCQNEVPVKALKVVMIRYEVLQRGKLIATITRQKNDKETTAWCDLNIKPKWTIWLLKYSIFRAWKTKGLSGIKLNFTYKGTKV